MGGVEGTGAFLRRADEVERDQSKLQDTSVLTATPVFHVQNTRKGYLKATWIKQNKS